MWCPRSSLPGLKTSKVRAGSTAPLSASLTLPLFGVCAWLPGDPGFARFLERVKDKGVFKGAEPGTAEYEAVYRLIVDKFRARTAQKKAKASGAAAPAVPGAGAGAAAPGTPDAAPAGPRATSAAPPSAVAAAPPVPAAGREAAVAEAEGFKEKGASRASIVPRFVCLCLWLCLWLWM